MEKSEKEKKYIESLGIMCDIKYIVNDSAGVEAMYVDGIDGDEKDSTALIIADVCSFTTFNPIAKVAFQEALSLADAVNFSTNNDSWIRITLSFWDVVPARKMNTEIKMFEPKG